MNKIMMMLLGAVLLGVCGCRVSDVRTFAVDVPGMTTQADVEKIQVALGTIGLPREKIAVDLAGRKIVVTYDSMIVAHKNIEVAIAEAGYDANRVKALKK
jgi:copper chaperone CopZ